ncbi:IS200/IS605 family transposase [bacterium]|nr:MAG: IS200/IS605 family transposase [bacterium]
MRHNKLALYAHFIWSTWDREWLISPEIERRLWRAIQSEAELHGCDVIAVGGIEDHVHLLVSFPPTVAISFILKQVKGVSSLFANAELGMDGSFKWQGGYAAFSVSRWDVKKLKNYIQNQRQHHENGTTKPELELSDSDE